MDSAFTKSIQGHQQISVRNFNHVLLYDLLSNNHPSNHQVLFINMEVIFDLVSDAEPDTASNPVVADTVSIPVIDTSDEVHSVGSCNGDSEVDLRSDSEVDSDFLAIKPEEKMKWKRIVEEEPEVMHANKCFKTSANKYIRNLRKSKVLLKQILLELEDSEGVPEDKGEAYEGDVDVGDLDNGDYDIGPVIQTA